MNYFAVGVCFTSYLRRRVQTPILQISSSLRSGDLENIIEGKVLKRFSSTCRFFSILFLPRDSSSFPLPWFDLKTSATFTGIGVDRLGLSTVIPRCFSIRIWPSAELKDVPCKPCGLKIQWRTCGLKIQWRSLKREFTPFGDFKAFDFPETTRSGEIYISKQACVLLLIESSVVVLRPRICRSKLMRSLSTCNHPDRQPFQGLLSM